VTKAKGSEGDMGEGVNNLFQLGNFKSHSGETLPWKIDCDALVLQDWTCLARMIAEEVGAFGRLEGVPKGGLDLMEALRFHRHQYLSGPLLIVDDVLTTGRSMEEQRAGRDAIGAVVFARGPCPSWVTPLFQMDR